MSDWVRCFDDETENEYWYNEETGEARWTYPAASVWQQMRDDMTGLPYWFNGETGESTWERPDSYESSVSGTEEEEEEEEEEEDADDGGGDDEDDDAAEEDGSEGGSDDEQDVGDAAILDSTVSMEMRVDEDEATVTLVKKYRQQYLHRSFLASLPLFNNISSQDVVSVAQLFTLRRFAAGGEIIVEGEAVDSLFVVVRGIVSLSEQDPTTLENVYVQHVQPGEAFCADAVLLPRYSAKHTATAHSKAENPAEDYIDLLVLSTGVLESCMGHSWVLSTKNAALTGVTGVIRNVLLHVPFFKDLNETIWGMVAEKMTVVQHREKHTIVAEGSPGDAFYVVVHGTLAVTQRGRRTADITPGSFFGEIALMKGVPCTATVSSVTSCLLLVLPKTSFTELITNSVTLKQALEVHIQQCTVQSVKNLRVPLLQGISEEGLAHLARSVTYSIVNAATVIFREGMVEDFAYIVTQGVVDVRKTANGVETLTQVGSGSILGSDALIHYTTMPRACTAVAATSVSLLKVGRSEIRQVLGHDTQQIAVFEIRALGDKVAIRHLLRLPSTRAACLDHLSAHIDPQLLHFIVGADEFTQMAFMTSPSGAKIPSPSQELVSKCSDLVDRYCHSQRDIMLTAVSEQTLANIVTSASAVTSIQTPLPPTLFREAIRQIEASVKPQFKELKQSPSFERLMNEVTATTSDGDDGNAIRRHKRGMSKHFACAKMNRYSKWQDRTVNFDFDRSQMLFWSNKTTRLHSFRLLGFKLFERIAKDSRQLRLVFRDADSRDILLRFQDQQSRDDFCLVAHMLEPDMVFTDDCERHDSSGRVEYDVTMVTKGVNVKRILIVDPEHSIIRRLNPQKDTFTDLPIDDGVRLEPNLNVLTRVRIVHDSEEGDTTKIEVEFPSPTLRERFCGQVRALVYGLDMSSVRVLGLHKAGYRGDTLSIFVGCWNVGDSKPPRDTTALSAWVSPFKYDVYAIGLQECDKRDEWLKSFEMLLSPGPSMATSKRKRSAYSARRSSHVGAAKPGGGGGGKGRKFFGAEDDKDGLPLRTTPYVCLNMSTLWGIHLFIFVRDEIAPHISNIVHDTEATGIGGVMGNKGGVAVGFIYREATSIAFVTSHLAARASRVAQRAANYEEICRNLTMTQSNRTRDVQFLHQYQHVFWMGDLNYRLDLGNGGTAEEFAKVQRIIGEGDFGYLLSKDQLNRELKNGRIFAGFQEGRVTFAPTYRMLKGKPGYSNKKNQNPSYTDRILWRSYISLRNSMQQLYYDSTPSLINSDHRPVGSGFLLQSALPFLHLKQSSSAFTEGHCHISFGHLRFSSTVLQEEDVRAAEVGLEIPVAARTSRGASATANGGGGGAAEEAMLALEEGPLSLKLVAPFLVEPTLAQPANAVIQNMESVAEWSDEMIPDINPYVADAKWLQGQHLLATIRRRAGTLVGHAEIPLADAFTMMTHPLGSGELTLAVVLEHPLLAKAFKAHVHRELSSENLEFFRAVQSFKQDATSGISGKELAERADAVMEYCRAKKGGMFDSDGGGQVLLTSRTQRRLQESMKKDINANMFDEAVADVFRLMERDSFPRFLKSFKFGEDMKSKRTGAPFCVHLVRDGSKVGILSGRIAMSSLDVLTERDERLNLLSQIMQRRGSQRSGGPVDDDDVGVESDDEKELMAELMSVGPKTSRRLSIMTAPDPSGGGRRDSVMQSAAMPGVVDEDELDSAVAQALDDARGDRTSVRLRALLQLTYTRMKAAERRMQQLSRSEG